MNVFPVSIHRHYDNVEAAIISKIMSGECSSGILKKLSYGLSLLLKSRGDKDSWRLMIVKILLSIDSHLSDAFGGLDEDSRSSEAMKVFLLSSKDSPPPLGGLVVPDQTSIISARRPEQLLGSKICALMRSCTMMLTSFYPVQAPVPVLALLVVARRVLLFDGSLSQRSCLFGSTLKQEFICSELPRLQLHTLEIIKAVIKGLRSKLFLHAADIFRLLTEYMGRCTFPELRVRAYSIIKVLISMGGVGTASHVFGDIVNIVFVDLNPLAYKKDDPTSKSALEVGAKSRRKRKKHSTMAGSFEEQLGKDVEVEMPQTSFPTSVQIAALEVLEALLVVGRYWKSDNWRPKVDHLLISIAANAFKGGWSLEDRNVMSGEPSLVGSDFQLALLQALYASLVSPGCPYSSHFASGVELFRSGFQERGTKLAEFCGRALDRLMRMSTNTMLGTRPSINNYQGQGHKFPDTSFATGHSQSSTFQVGIQGKDPSEPESEDDDLYENWTRSDKDDEMEMQVTETRNNANDAAKPLVTTVVTSVPTVSEENDLGASASSPAEKMVVSRNDFRVESPVSETTKKQRRDSAPTTSSNLLISAQSDVVTLESVAFKPLGQDSAVKNNIDNGISVIDEMNASTSEKLVSESKNDNLAPIVDRLSVFLSRSEKSWGTVLESDNETADSFPDIVDGDPDSD
ncbi:proline-, glutamic acid- and leucine-rich protein 1 [Dorcoceras hygrometricum]|uniref:Proline-, glutamic acid-and leucine-rich protein 1 n=1 Tax=Dorcoceras hygrometricum TaxID=472368 RepID=A0A2Z7BU92_9LAMI|nr:proline-, glutamic acid- and leucine-rich protein 1 [Dorcoceras hygrometricum]